ncbi:MAG: hypothetical protein OEY86_13175 [Nitrospira sp.]|nr:hypothetical protein [Nitrospira sp.]
MDENVQEEPETKKLTVLEMIIIAFLGLTGIGLVYAGGFVWFAAISWIRAHGGGEAGAFINIVLPAIAVVGVTLIASAFQRAFGRNRKKSL